MDKIQKDNADAGLIREFAVLEPFGKANIKPQFADKNLSITKAFVVGKNQNVLRLNLLTAAGEAVSAVYFGDIEAFKEYYAEKYPGKTDCEAKGVYKNSPGIADSAFRCPYCGGCHESL